MGVLTDFEPMTPACKAGALPTAAYTPDPQWGAGRIDSDLRVYQAAAL